MAKEEFKEFISDLKKSICEEPVFDPEDFDKKIVKAKKFGILGIEPKWFFKVVGCEVKPEIRRKVRRLLERSPIFKFRVDEKHFFEKPE